MKAWKLAAAMAGVVLFLGSCGTDLNTTGDSAASTPAKTEAGTTTEAEQGTELADGELSLEEKSKGLALQVVSGDFASVTAEFNDTLKSSLSEADFQTGWEQVVVQAGSFEEYYKTEVEESSKVYHCILKFEERGVRLSFGYDEEGKVQSIWTDFYAIPPELVENDRWKEQEISIPFTSNGTEYSLTGVLTLPTGVKKPPIVVLVQGSGQSDYNESIQENRPFQDIAWGLAEKGIASIRYNKRYYQFPAQAPDAITVSDEVLDDAATAISFASRLESVESSQIYLIGHSLGGMLAPKITKENAQVAGMISLAGSPRHLADIVYDQNVDALNQMENINELQKQASLAQLKQMIDQVKSVSDLTDTTALIGQPASYWASLNEIDTAALAKELTVPMLFLQGTADFQVKVDTDFAAWKEALEGHENAHFQVYDGLNHLFMKTNGKTDISEYDTQGHVDQKVIDDIAAFIQENAIQ
ncbi:alpha/beta hydrolase [Hominifimenecus sp. rT4P-3]|uniref:alpha/beta hydrolase n=1 Tax=Hominifimenecus sp. rT4P-3 TaxID=3242979 RepID=UPI003DA2A6D7